MHKPIRIVIVAADKRLVERIASLTRGSHIEILGWVGLSANVISGIASQTPSAVVLDGNAEEEDYLSIVRGVTSLSPCTQCILFGNSIDVAVMARAVATGVKGYLPTTITYPDFVAAVTHIVDGRPPSTETVFTRTATAMVIPVADDAVVTSSGNLTFKMKKLVTTCLILGLTVSQTAGYLALPEDQVMPCLLPTTVEKSPRNLSHGGKYKPALILVILAVFATIAASIFKQPLRPVVRIPESLQEHLIYIGRSQTLETMPLVLKSLTNPEPAVASMALAAAEHMLGVRYSDNDKSDPRRLVSLVRQDWLLTQEHLRRRKLSKGSPQP